MPHSREGCKPSAGNACAPISDARRGDPSKVRPRPDQQTVRLDRPFAALPHAVEGDRRLRPIDKAILLALLWFAKGRPSCWPSNDSIGDRAGCSGATVKRRLAHIESCGHLLREEVRPTLMNMTGRLITLAWRLDPSYLDAIGRSDDARSRVSPHNSCEVTPSSIGKNGKSGAESTVPTHDSHELAPSIIGKNGKTDLATNSDGTMVLAQPTGSTIPDPRGGSPAPPEERSSSSSRENPGRTADGPGTGRQRPGSTATTTSPIRSTPNAADPDPLARAKIAPQARSTTTPSTSPSTPPCSTTASTPGQRQFLEALTPEQRNRFDSARPERQALLLGMFSGGYDAVTARIALAELPRAVIPAGPAPTSTVEALERLPGGAPGLIAEVAERLVREFGSDADRRLWGAFYSLAGQVWRGDVEVEAVLDARRQALGPQTRNRGAVFTHALRAHGWSP